MQFRIEHLTPVRWISRVVVIACCLALHAFLEVAAASLKPRIVVLTDISPVQIEPDDMESMIRLLAHADLFEIEALVATTGWSNAGNKADWIKFIHEVIDAYEKDLPNLRKRSQQEGHKTDESRQEIGYWPSPEYLRSVTILGSQKRGMAFIGNENQSPASELVLKLADEPDERPLWVQVWGGGNTLAQSVWKAKQERNPEELKMLLRKLRVYTITDQDGTQKRGNVIEWAESSHQWMRREFEKNLFFIWDESAWKYQNAAGKSNWDEYAKHIQNHGHLGSMYPKYKYGVEGDTPSFLHVIPNGLNNPDDPSQAGWGGYFEFGECKDHATKAYQNHAGSANNVSSKYQQYFYPATFNNFAARMDWARDGKGNRNPIVAINDDSGLAIVTNSPPVDSSVALDASKSSDPDGDKITFKWWVLPEAGTYSGNIDIASSDSSRATVKIPEDAAGRAFHVICEVTDDGAHKLTAYRRIIFTPKAK